MSTGAEHVPDAAHPDARHAAGAHLDDADRATTRLLVVSIVATLSVAWTLVLVYAYTSQGGVTLSAAASWALALGVAVVPGLLAAWAVRLVSATSEGTPTPYFALAPICVVLMMCGVVIVAAFGARAHDDGQVGGGQGSVVAAVLVTGGPGSNGGGITPITLSIAPD